MAISILFSCPKIIGCKSSPPPLIPSKKIKIFGKCPENIRKMSGKCPENVRKMFGKCPENVRNMFEKIEKVVPFDQKVNSETMFDYKKRLQTQNYLRNEPVTYQKAQTATICKQF